MGAWWNAIRGNLSRLLQFSGREAKGSFWLYVGGVALFVIGLGAIHMSSLMAETMGAMQEFAEANPDKATITSGPGHYSISIEGHHPELFPDTGEMMVGLITFFALSIILLAAAVTRRLHDFNMRGAWGLLPLPFIVFSTLAMPRIFAAPEPEMTSFFLIFVSNLLYLASLAVLCILLARDGDPEANRFGEPPGN